MDVWSQGVQGADPKKPWGPNKLKSALCKGPPRSAQAPAMGELVAKGISFLFQNKDGTVPLPKLKARKWRLTWLDFLTLCLWSALGQVRRLRTRDFKVLWFLLCHMWCLRWYHRWHHRWLEMTSCKHSSMRRGSKAVGLCIITWSTQLSSAIRLPGMFKSVLISVWLFRL